MNFLHYITLQLLSNPGAQFGTVVALPLAGELCGGAWGWPSVFYTMGIAAIVWAVLWFFLGADTPANSRLISKAERDYIQTSLGQDGEKTVIIINNKYFFY